jgi:hypothetical protein
VSDITTADGKAIWQDTLVGRKTQVYRSFNK